MIRENSGDNLRTRLAFLRADDDTRATLQTVWQEIQPALGPTLDGFYDHVLSVPALRDKIGSRDISALKDAQRNHWERLFSGTFDDEYLAFVERIGMAHVRVGLEPRWYMGGYCFVLNNIATYLVKQTGRRAGAELSQKIEAVNTAVFLDMDIAMSIYYDTLKEEAAATLRGHSDAFDAEIGALVDAVASAASGLDRNAEDMSRLASDAGSEATAAAAATGQVSGSVDTIAASVEELSASVRDISQQTSQSTLVVGRAEQEARDSSARIEGLTEAVEKIGDVVSLINDIASQTNLLALNATIEAARAGVAGKGFAVVASEVKALANQTAQATDSVTQHISDVRAATQDTVGAIGRIAETIREVNEISSSVAAAVEQQGSATEEISRNIQEAAKGSGAMATTVETVRGMVEQTGGTSGEVKSAARDLADRAGNLKGAVASFIAQLRGDTGKEDQAA